MFVCVLDSVKLFIRFLNNSWSVSHGIETEHFRSQMLIPFNFHIDYAH